MAITAFLTICYVIAIIDRGNIGMASLQMNEDLGLTATAFGFASSLFFFAYFLFEVPSNLAMQKIWSKSMDCPNYGDMGGNIIRNCIR